VKRILVVFGTRPEAIKMAPVIEVLKKEKQWCELKVCVTAQHREMLDQVLSLFQIDPDIDLSIMAPGQDLFDITTRVISSLKEVLMNEKPDLVLVHGDTTTTFATTLSCYYLKIPVAHVEAGLRTGDLHSPWPEEANRHLTSVLATYHFAPTLIAKQNLQNESISDKSVFVTGNTVVDALLTVVQRLKTDSGLYSSIESRYSSFSNEKKMILVTGHRRENFGAPFKSFCLALKTLSERDDVEIVYPVHLNPNVQKPVNNILSDRPNVHLLEPVDYLDFVYLMMNCYFIVTDSGGIQEEAPSLGKPVLLTRNTSERPEGIHSNTVKLVGTDRDVIVSSALTLLDDDEYYQQISEENNPYGDGKAASRIRDHIKQVLV